MKNVILIFGILTTVMVYGVVAGVSTNASPPELDMNLDETQCRDCHGDNVQSEHHSLPWGNDKCCECHNPDFCSSGKVIEMEYTCGFDGDCHNSSNPATDHHNFVLIFDNDDWDCLICHEKGVPRPINK